MGSTSSAPTSSGRSQVTRSALLVATSNVIRSEGAGALTLERVAAEAGVSKGGLLYHFRSKQELIEALLVDALDDADARLTDLTEGSEPGAFARAWLSYVEQGEHQDRSVGPGMFAFAALLGGNVGPAGKRFDEWADRFENDGIDPTVALLVRMVADGVVLSDQLGIAPPSAEQRRDLIALVKRLLADDVAKTPEGTATQQNAAPKGVSDH